MSSQFFNRRLGIHVIEHQDTVADWATIVKLLGSADFLPNWEVQVRFVDPRLLLLLMS